MDSEQNFEREYRASFEECWRAVQQAIIAYPLKINNYELGQIQTTSIRSNAYFKHPYEQRINRGGSRYNLTINVFKMGPKSTKVSVIKDTAIHRDFVSSPEVKVSSGLEEGVILYRVSRELDIEKALLQASKRRK